MSRKAAFSGVMRWSESGSRTGALVMGRHLFVTGLVQPKLTAIKVSGCHLILVIALRSELADLDEVEAERLDLGQYAVERRPVQQAREHGVGAAPQRHQRGERGQHRRAQVAVDPDRVQD